MSLLSRFTALFSSSPSRSAQPTAMPSEYYQEYEIIPMPASESGQYRLNGLIKKGDQEHQIIRADLFTNKEDCAKEVIRKSRLLIDQMGDKLFG